MDDPRYTYRRDERRPVEVLVFEMEPDQVSEFLRADHDVWTLGEALLDELDRIPFLSKEVWLDDAHPGRVTLVFVWESQQSWNRVGQEGVQRRLQTRFDDRFAHPVRLIRALHDESRNGIHRWSRFERRE